MAQRYELDLRDYYRIINRHKGKIAATTLTVGFIVFVLSSMIKPEPLYRATTSVKIERKSAGADIYRGFSASREYNVLESQTRVLQSFPIVIEAAKEIGLIAADTTIDKLQEDRESLNKVVNLQRQIEVDQIGNTNIISISIESTDRFLCRDAANAIAFQYKLKNFEDNKKQASTTRKFIETRLHESRKKLERAEEALKTYEQNNNIVDLDIQSKLSLQSQVNSEAQLTSIINRIRKLELIVGYLNKKRESYDEIMIDVRRDSFSNFFQNMITKLSELIAIKKTLLNVYTEKNPEVIAVQNQINSTINNIKGQLDTSLEILYDEKDGILAELQKSEENLNLVPDNNLINSRLRRQVNTVSEIVMLLDRKYNEALIREADQMEQISIVRPAFLPMHPINSPRIMQKTIFGFVLGFIIGLIFAFIFENFDTSFGTIDDVEDIMKLPVIGVLPYMNLKELVTANYKDDTSSPGFPDDGNISQLVMHFFPKSAIAETFRSLRANVKFSSQETNAKIITITSSQPSEGKSFVCANLALCLAQGGNRVLLIDSDLRKPVLHRTFGVDNVPGLVELVLESAEISSVKRDVTDIIVGKIGIDMIAKTPGWDNLEFIPSGSGKLASPSEILNSNKMASLLKQWKEEYDFVVIDSAPVLASSDSLLISPLADKTMLIYKVGEVARGSLLRSKTLLDGVKANIMGITLNGLKPGASADFGHQYHDYYGEKKGSQEAQTIYSKVSSAAVSGLNSLRKKVTPDRDASKPSGYVKAGLNVFQKKGKSEKATSKSSRIILPGVIFSLIISAFLYDVRSMQDIISKFGEIDFLMTGAFFVFMGLFYFSARALANIFFPFSRPSPSQTIEKQRGPIAETGRRRGQTPEVDKEKDFSKKTLEPSLLETKVAGQSAQTDSFDLEEEKIGATNKKIEKTAHPGKTDSGPKEWDSFLNPKVETKLEEEKIGATNKKIEETAHPGKTDSGPKEWDSFLNPKP